MQRRDRAGSDWVKLAPFNRAQLLKNDCSDVLRIQDCRFLPSLLPKPLRLLAQRHQMQVYWEQLLCKSFKPISRFLYAKWPVEDIFCHLEKLHKSSYQLKQKIIQCTKFLARYIHTVNAAYLKQKSRRYFLLIAEIALEL